MFRLITVFAFLGRAESLALTVDCGTTTGTEALIGCFALKGDTSFTVHGDDRKPYADLGGTIGKYDD